MPIENNASPPVPRQVADRSLWVKAAFDALARHGAGGLRVETLAKACGVTKGSFYWHFKDRKALVTAVLETWRDGRIRDIVKQTQAEPGRELAQIHHVIDIYSSRRNRRGMTIELAVREWARRDEEARGIVEEVDAIRLERARGLFVACGMSKAEASGRSVLLYAYVFGFSLMACDRFDTDIDTLKTDIIRRIAELT